MEVVLTQSHRFHNCWSLVAVEFGEVVTFSADPLTRNGAFAADLMVANAVRNHHEIVGIYPQEDYPGAKDTNMDAAEGALYRAAHGAFDLTR